MHVAILKENRGREGRRERVTYTTWKR